MDFNIFSNLPSMNFQGIDIIFSNAGQINFDFNSNVVNFSGFTCMCKIEERFIILKSAVFIDIIPFEVSEGVSANILNLNFNIKDQELGLMYANFAVTFEDFNKMFPGL